ncbi:MAG: hypothetical protein J0H68_07095 [Sphingobacteriia bacterium]|nr:hypothetical protein [Sphingobacteriia bacterium]
MVGREEIAGSRSLQRKYYAIEIHHIDDIEKIFSNLLENKNIFLKNYTNSIYYLGIGYINAMVKLTEERYNFTIDKWIFDAADSILAVEQGVKSGFKIITSNLEGEYLKLAEEAAVREKITLTNYNQIKAYDMLNFNEKSFNEFLGGMENEI